MTTLGYIYPNFSLIFYTNNFSWQVESYHWDTSMYLFLLRCCSIVVIITCNWGKPQRWQFARSIYIEISLEGFTQRHAR